MRRITRFIFFFSCFQLSAQLEGLVPIQSQNRGNKTQQLSIEKSSSSTFNGQFTYQLDTISLPIFDDFSRDKFQHYDAQIGDTNITDEFYSRMLDMGDVPFPMGTKFSDVQTFYYKIDTSAHHVDTIPLSSTSIKWNDLATYPVGTYAVETVFPPYSVYDTLDFPNQIDTFYVVDPVYVQDTAVMHIVRVHDSTQIWADNQAYRNYTKAVNPWSLGVATFDGLDENGYPYAINTNYEDYADALTSKSIDLNFLPSDSIYLTFLYQAEGYGDVPEAEDSLILQFFNVTDQVWVNIWGVSGSGVAEFKEVHLPITHANYLQKGFKFRFRNYGGLSGDLDNWHIDYVYLRRLSTITDTEIEDFSIVYPIVSLLKDYSSVPWKHFRNSPSGHMNSGLQVKVKNASNQVANSSDPVGLSVFYQGSLEGTFAFPGGMMSAPDPDYYNNTLYSPALDFTGGYEFNATLPNDTLADFDFYFKATEPTLTEFSYLNDTTFGTQYFRNFYAYDDWSAEYAYGLNTAQSMLALKFTPYQADSLVGVQMHFVPTVNDQTTKTFLLTVWDDAGGVPGNVLYQDEYYLPSSPIYEFGYNQYHNYYFKDMQKIYVGGTFYVGWRQLDDGKLGIGFDRNTDSQTKTFITPNQGTPWINSSISGTVMIRPVISSKMDYQLGFKEQNLPVAEASVKIFPNPVSNEFQLEADFKIGKVELYAIDGSKVKEWETNHTSFQLDGLMNGLYIVRIYNEYQNCLSTQKLIKE